MESEVGRDATIAEADIKSEFATGTDGAVHDEEERLIHSKTGSLKNERRWTAGAELVEGKIVRYDMGRIVSLLVFIMKQGTIFDCRKLWLEQLVLMIIAAVSGLLMYLAFTYHIQKDDRDPEETLDLANRKLYEFATSIMGLVTFVLGLFVSLVVERWWRLYKEGLDKLQRGVTFLVSTLTTFYGDQYDRTAEKIIHRIYRYGRLSLALIYASQLSTAKEQREFVNMLFLRGLATDEEAGVLLSMRRTREEIPWVWIHRILHRLYLDGVIPSDHMYTLMTQRASIAQDGAAFILGQLGTQLPMTYVHMVSLLVKVNNIVVAVAIGPLIFISFVQHPDGTGGDSTQLVPLTVYLLTILIIPVLFNGLLIVCQQIDNPFANSTLDYPGWHIDQAMRQDAVNIIRGSHHYDPCQATPLANTPTYRQHQDAAKTTTDSDNNHRVDSSRPQQQQQQGAGGDLVEPPSCQAIVNRGCAAGGSQQAPQPAAEEPPTSSVSTRAASTDAQVHHTAGGVVVDRDTVDKFWRIMRRPCVKRQLGDKAVGSLTHLFLYGSLQQVSLVQQVLNRLSELHQSDSQLAQALAALTGHLSDQQQQHNTHTV